MEIGIGLIQLDGGELGVVLWVHALVAEDAANFVHAVQPAHNQPLEGQLGGDAHIHIQVQRVVVRDERARRGAAGNGVQHGRLHFHIAHVVQIFPHELDELRAHLKRAAHLGVHNEVYIALAEAQLGVAQAVELFRQRQQAFGKQRHLGGMHADLAHFGAEQIALYANDVANVKLFEIGIGLVAHIVAAHINLNITLVVAQVGKACLAHYTLGHHAAGHAHRFAKLALRHVGEPGFRRGGIIGLRVFGNDERVFARVAQSLQFFMAYLHNLVIRLLCHLARFFGLVQMLRHGLPLLLFLIFPGAPQTAAGRRAKPCAANLSITQKQALSHLF